MKLRINDRVKHIIDKRKGTIVDMTPDSLYVIDWDKPNPEIDQYAYLASDLILLAE